jgi:hypothetical protein
MSPVKKLIAIARLLNWCDSYFATSASRLSKLRRAKKALLNIRHGYLRRVDNRPKARSQWLELLEIGRRCRYVRKATQYD